MIPNHYIKNGCFTKHPLKHGCLGYQVWDTAMTVILLLFLPFPPLSLSNEKLGPERLFLAGWEGYEILSSYMGIMINYHKDTFKEKTPGFNGIRKVWVFFVAHLWNLSKYFFPSQKWHGIFPRRSKLREDGSFRIRFIDFEAIAAGKCRCEQMMSKPLLWWIYIYKAWPMTWARCAEYPFASFAKWPMASVGITWNDQLWPVGIWSWWKSWNSGRYSGWRFRP